MIPGFDLCLSVSTCERDIENKRKGETASTQKGGGHAATKACSPLAGWSLRDVCMASRIVPPIGSHIWRFE